MKRYRNHCLKKKTFKLTAFFAGFFSAYCALINTSMANPVLGNIAAGQVSVQQSGAVTTINQGTKNGIINWQSFNIGNGEATHFIQPLGGITLNRISPLQGVSQIYGTLTATGRIILVNPAGIYFGPSSYVNVGGLVATTRNITDQNFLNGTYQFDPDSNGYNGSIVNEGQIIAQNHGLIALVGANVTNTGLVQAELGSVVLASGDSATLTFPDHGLFNFAITAPTSLANSRTGVKNTGRIRADAGTVMITANAAQGVLDQAINLGGIVEARSIGMQNGNIVLSGGSGGVVTIDGTLDATGTHINQTGGQVNVTAKNILLDKDSLIDVSGTLGGGNVNIGGNYHGSGPLPNAAATVMLPGAAIHADAITQGNGGNVILWSDNWTAARGSISAMGGSNGGNGGFVETSSHDTLATQGLSVNLTAPHGTGGTWLIDPQQITIVGAGTTTGSFTTGDIFTPSSDMSTILNTDLEAVLNQINLHTFSGPNVIITTSGSGTQEGDIIVAAPLAWGGFNTLTLSAYRDIIVNNGVTINTFAPLTVSTPFGTFNFTGDAAGLNLIANNAGAFAVGSGHGTVSIPNGAIVLNPNRFTPFTSKINYNPSNYHTPIDYSAAFSTNVNLALQSYMNVSNTADLQTLSQDSTLWHGAYSLATNLDASGLLNFNPIGNAITPFSGIFDGLGHSINHLTINNPTGINVGLFGVLSQAKIANLGLVDEQVTGLTNVGGLAGSFSSSSIVNSYVTGAIHGSAGSTNVGGLVGFMYFDSAHLLDVFSNTFPSTTIRDSYSLANVTAGDNSSNIGGFVGQNKYGLFSNVDISGLGDTRSSTIYESYSRGSVVAGANSNNIGGFVGLNFDDREPGTGLAQNAGFIHTYSTGYVSAGTGSTAIGGFVGALAGQSGNQNVANDFLGSLWDTSTSGQATSAAAIGVPTNKLMSFVFLSTLPYTGGLGFDDGNIFTNPFDFPNWGILSTPVGQPIPVTSNPWGIIDGQSYPYLLLGYKTTPQVISGKLQPLDPVNGNIYNVADQPISLLVNGSTVGDNTHTGANGFFYFLENAGSVTANAIIDLYVNGTTRANLIQAGINGTNNNLLINPNDLTVNAPSGIDLTLTSQQSADILDPAGISVVATSGLGTIRITDSLNWNMNNSIILSAYNNIITDAGVNLSSTSGGLLLHANNLGDFEIGPNGNVLVNGTLNVGGPITIYSNTADATYTPRAYSNAGAGQITAYMLIHDAQALQTISNTSSLWSSNFALSHDINAGSLSNYTPIGNATTAFSGKFDGLGFSISNLTINTPTLNDVGFIGVNTGTIKNLGLLGEKVFGVSQVGGLVGSNAGELTNVFSEAKVTASGNNVGGLVGFNTGNINNAYSSGLVTASGGANIGGLVGNNSGANLTHIYSLAGVDGGVGSTHVGGLVGANSGDISVAYAANTVLGTHDIGALVGSNTGSVSNSFWDTGFAGALPVIANNTGTSSQLIAGCFGSSTCANGGAVDLTQATTFSDSSSAWDFENTWSILPGQSYPYLRSLFSTTPLVLSGHLNSTDPISGVVYPTVSAQSINVAGNGTWQNGTLSATDGSFYFLERNQGAFATDSPFLLYTEGSAIKGNTIGLVIPGSVSNLVIDPNTLTMMGTKHANTTESILTGVAHGVVEFHTYPIYSNALLASMIGDLNPNDLLYTAMGNDINVKSGNNFTTQADTYYILNGNLSTTHGTITFGGYNTTMPDFQTDPNAVLQIGQLDPSYNGNVTIQTIGSGDIHANAFTMWPITTAIDNDTLNLISANKIVINEPIFAMDSTIAIDNLNGNLNISAEYSDKSITTGPYGFILVNKFNLLQGKWYQVDPFLLDNISYLQTYYFFARDFKINSSILPSTQAEFIRARGGDGTPSSPYNLVDLYGLQGVGSDPYTLGSSWKVDGSELGWEGSNEYVLSGSKFRYNGGDLLPFWNDGGGFIPIGNAEHPFTGTFDGGFRDGSLFTPVGFSAILRFDSIWPSLSNVGLFGVTSSSAVISDLFLQVGLVQGSTNVGSVVGDNHGTIRNVYVIPYTVGNLNVGGIAGSNSGTIEDSTTQSGFVGGLANVGGIVGKNLNSGTINRTLVADYVTGFSKAGGIAGVNGGSILNSFWDTDYTGLSQSAGLNLGTTSHVLGGCFTGQCSFGGTVNLTSIQPYLDAGWDIIPADGTTDYFYHLYNSSYGYITSLDGWGILPNNQSYPFFNAQFASILENPITVFAGFALPALPKLTVFSYWNSGDIFMGTNPAITGANGFFYSLKSPEFSYLPNSTPVFTSVVSQNAVGLTGFTYNQANGNGSVTRIPLIVTKTGLPDVNPIGRTQIFSAVAGIYTLPDLVSLPDSTINVLLNIFYGKGSLSQVLGYNAYYYNSVTNSLYNYDSVDRQGLSAFDMSKLIADIIKDQNKLSNRLLEQKIYSSCVK